MRARTFGFLARVCVCEAHPEPDPAPDDMTKLTRSVSIFAELAENSDVLSILLSSRCSLLKSTASAVFFDILDFDDFGS